MRGWWQDLTDLVLPAECGGCGRPRTVLCPECRAALNGVAPRRVRPVPEPPGLPAVYAAARYADAVRAVLLAHKERGALALAGPLGSALAGAVWAGVREVCEPEGGGSASGCAPGPWERGYVGGEGQVREASASSTEARDAEAVTRGRGDWPGSDARGRGGDRQVGAEGVAYGSYVRSGAEVLTGVVTRSRAGALVVLGGGAGSGCPCCSFPCRRRGGPCELVGMIPRGGSHSRRRRNYGGRECRRGWQPSCGSGGGGRSVGAQLPAAAGESLRRTHGGPRWGAAAGTGAGRAGRRPDDDRRVADGGGTGRLGGEASGQRGTSR